MGVNAATGTIVPQVGSDIPAQLAEGGSSHGSSEEEDDKEEVSGEEACEKEANEEEEVAIAAIFEA